MIQVAEPNVIELVEALTVRRFRADGSVAEWLNGLQKFVVALDQFGYTRVAFWVRPSLFSYVVSVFDKTPEDKTQARVFKLRDHAFFPAIHIDWSGRVPFKVRKG